MGIYVRSMKESLVHGVQYLLSTSCFGRMQTHSVQRSNFVDDHAYYQNRSKVSYRAASHKWTCMEDIWWTFSNGYKINGSGIYTVCLSFTERLVLWFLADSYLQMSELMSELIFFPVCTYFLCCVSWLGNESLLYHAGTRTKARCWSALELTVKEILQSNYT